MVVVVVVSCQVESTWMGFGNSFGFVMRGLCAHAVRGENPPGNVNSKCSNVIVASCVVGGGPTLPTLPLPEWKNTAKQRRNHPSLYSHNGW